MRGGIIVDYEGMRGITFTVNPADKVRVRSEGTGVVIEGACLLSPGIWVDSAIGTPLKYTEKALSEFANHWHSNRLWSVHTGGMPRPITNWIGDITNPRFENGALRGDLFFHMLTDESKDTVALVKAGIEGKIQPVSFSIEHEGREVYNANEGCYEAQSFLFHGGAIVDEGASGGTKIMGESVPAIRYLSEYKKTDIMKELEIKPEDNKMIEEELIKRLSSIEERITALESAAKPDEQIDNVKPEEVEKMLSAKVAPLTELVEKIGKQVTELSKQPAPERTLAAPEHVETDIKVLSRPKIERGVITEA